MDLTDAAGAIAAGRGSAAEALEACLAAAAAPAQRHAFLRRFDTQARVAAGSVDTLRDAGVPVPPLAGLAVSVKDLFDIAGVPTTGGSASLRDAPSAAADCPAVARLRAAGAAIVGHTNLTEFAYSGVGINRHHGTPANAATAAIDPLPRIPGGSTSGGAVSVAGGAAWAALGSDTGGSIRIPAALQGLVGFKNTARRTPTAGCIPLSTTLDTACAITRSVRDAVLLHEVLASRRVALRGRPVAALRLGVPQTLMLDALEPAVAAAFDSALRRLSSAGARIERIALPELADTAPLLAGGGFPAAESWAWHRHRLAEREADYDPRVLRRIRPGAAMTAADYIDLQHARAAWIARMEAALAPFDAMLSPTVPLVAPPLAPLVDDDEAFFAANARLLRNTVPVNLLDGCAISLPCQDAGALPVGLMLWDVAMADDRLLDAASAVEATLAGR
jgi:amidase/aspartyl-tRNA(Asn)/glutamyl-tRNA(Gln) amidotransferase subunit A